MNETFAYCKGYLCLKMSDRLSSEPVLVTHYWPFFEIPGDDVLHLLGLPAFKSYSGVYMARYKGIQQHFRLNDGGKTLPIETLQEPIPCPKVRTGIETRYQNGHWEKRIKSGWVIIG